MHPRVSRLYLLLQFIDKTLIRFGTSNGIGLRKFVALVFDFYEHFVHFLTNTFNKSQEEK